MIYLFFLPFFLMAKPFEGDVAAKSAVLMNANTGVILFEKEAHTPLHPASTTKIATALFVLENKIDLDRMTTVSGESLRLKPLKDRELAPAFWLESDGVAMGLKRGETVSLESLLHGLMLLSGNDAANVIAESVGGSVPKFMDMVNAYLKNIGCHNTHFRNPHGLTHPEHLSTAYDLALMMQKALRLEKFRKLISSLSYSHPKTNKQESSELKQFNPLIKPKSKHYYAKAIGGKTGYTKAAKYNLVAAAEDQGRELIAVVMGCETSADRFEEVKKLFEMAFKEKKEKRRLIDSEHVFAKEIDGAKSTLRAGLAKDLSIEYFPSEEPKCKALLYWDTTTLPIQKGQKVGEVHVQNEQGLFLQKGDLLALDEVKGTFLFRIKNFFRSITK
jgi:D-alanyl-D-alanine carboxypeptidase (penicillin-binding protein 5/6)